MGQQHTHMLQRCDERVIHKVRSVDASDSASHFLPRIICICHTMPQKWSKLYDEASGQYYYLNSMDGSSTWEKPSDYSEPTGSWTKEWDNNSNAYYYLNSATGESTWEKPPDFVEDTQNSVSSSKNTGENSGAQSVVLSIWDKIYDPLSGNY